MGLAALMCLIAPAQSGSSAAEYKSPLNIIADSDGQSIYVAETGANSIAVINIAEESIQKRIKLQAPPLALALCQKEHTLYVSTNSAAGKVFVVDINDEKVLQKISVGHTPTALVAHPATNRLYVCERFDNTVSVIDTDKHNKIAEIPVSREPVAATATLDGSRLYVANHLPFGSATARYVSASIEIVDTETLKVIKSIPLPNGSSSVRDMCLSPDGKFIYITHILGRYLVPTTQLERGWMNTNALSIIDVKKQEWANTVLLDDVDRGAANPWGVRCTDDGASMCVSLSGTDEIMIIDRIGLHNKLEKLNNGEIVSQVSRSPDDVQNDLSFLVGLKQRMRVDGKSPRGFAIVGSRLYVAQYFSDCIGIVDIRSERRHKSRSIALAPPQEMDPVRRGDMLFGDASLCFQQWQSCVSCHPDTRADGFNWDLLNDGIGNPKQVKSLVLAHKTPPAMITGVRDGAEVAVRSGIRYIQFAVRPEEEAAAIDEYLKSLQPVPSPHLQNGALSEAAQRGEQLFESTGCISCHSGEYFTDMKKYDLGMGEFKDKGVEFDVPTLREIWRTAPYLYDGRAATIFELLTTFNNGDKHGVTSQLSAKELKDLAEYVLSL